MAGKIYSPHICGFQYSRLFFANFEKLAKKIWQHIITLERVIFPKKSYNVSKNTTYTWPVLFMPCFFNKILLALISRKKSTKNSKPIICFIDQI